MVSHLKNGNVKLPKVMEYLFSLKLRKMIWFPERDKTKLWRVFDQDFPPSAVDSLTEEALVKCDRIVYAGTHRDVADELDYLRRHYYWIKFYPSKDSMLERNSFWRFENTETTRLPGYFKSFIESAGYSGFLSRAEKKGSNLRLNFTREIISRMDRPDVVVPVSLNLSISTFFHLWMSLLVLPIIAFLGETLKLWASIPATFYLKTSILPPATFYPQPNASPQRLPPATTVVYETPCTTTPCPSTPHPYWSHNIFYSTSQQWLRPCPKHPSALQPPPICPFIIASPTLFQMGTPMNDITISPGCSPLTDTNSPPFFPQVCPNTELEPLPTPAAPLPDNIFVPPHILPSFQPVPPHHTNAFYRPPFPPSHISTIDGDFCACPPHISHIDNLT
ncbi:hypothetical protein Fcan01_26428, partial [Folsomia candida]